MKRAPFAPLLASAAGLDAFPAAPTALIARMADVYGVESANILPVASATQALALIARRVAMAGRPSIAGAPSAALAQIAAVNRLDVVENADGAGLVALSSPDLEGATIALDDIAARANTLGATLLLIDESLIEFETAPSAIEALSRCSNLVVLRDLSFAYGLAGAPCAALIGNADLIAWLSEAREPEEIPAPIARLAVEALEPARVAVNARRIAELRDERTRLAAALPNARPAGGPFVWLSPESKDEAQKTIRRFAIDGEWRGERFLLALGSPDANDRARAAFGAPGDARPRRRAEIVRDTKETQIVVRLDLDQEGGCDVATGIGFFDHMLAQIALHGGFSLTLRCTGDLEVDGHHTIEDCALALGQALKEALGARRGLARFGFMLPMDETEARVSVDLGGRPYLVFEGAFTASHIGAYPTEMTEHVFRSLSQAMAASIHVHVEGENDHHKTEACYKAFGRALRQALRVEGDALPSTKGAI